MEKVVKVLRSTALSAVFVENNSRKKWLQIEMPHNKHTGQDEPEGRPAASKLRHRAVQAAAVAEPPSVTFRSALILFR